MHRERIAADRTGKFVEHQRTGIAFRWQNEFFTSLVAVEIQPLRRLPDVPALAAHDGEAEERLERRRRRNGIFRALAFGRDLVGKIRAEGLTVLIVEQNVQQVLDVVDRAYLLEVGAIKLSGTASELKGNSFIRESYLGL